MRDTDRWWFYWNFRAEGLQGREITFRFCDGDVVGYYGPAISQDGYHWIWLGPDSKLAEGYGFRCRFAPDEICVYLCCALHVPAEPVSRLSCSQHAIMPASRLRPT